MVTDQLPRAARDLARRRGKDVEVSITGAEIELDRAILDAIAEPLLHLLRNAIDHGIEDARGPGGRAGKPARGALLQLTVRRTRERVVLELEDDGRGMDPDELRAAAVARGRHLRRGRRPPLHSARRCSWPAFPACPPPATSPTSAAAAWAWTR